MKNDTTPYDIEQLEKSLLTQGTTLIYRAETTSTMTLAEVQGMNASVVLTDHQTAGKGRYSRSWHDEPGQSILATFSRGLPKDSLPPKGSLLLSHLFVLAVWQALNNKMIKIKWPNDLVIHDKKLAGVLLAEGITEANRQAILFGVGINIVAPNDEASGLFQITSRVNREAIIIAINQMLDTFLADLPRLSNPTTRQYYDNLWQQATNLVGRTIRVTHYGPVSDQILEGVVAASPFGGFLQLHLNNGGIIDMKDYGHLAHLEVIPS